MSVGEVKETLMVIGSFGGKNKKGQGQVYYVPIRDWNYAQVLVGECWQKVYYVPIRDWNNALTICFWADLGSLLRSYKGLKLQIIKEEKEGKNGFITFL